MVEIQKGRVRVTVCWDSLLAPRQGSEVGDPMLKPPAGILTHVPGATLPLSDAASGRTLSTDVFQAAPGDQNGDGRFEFDDVFEAFAAGGAKYGTEASADWTEGDFDLDRKFDFDDIFHAFAVSGALQSRLGSSDRVFGIESQILARPGPRQSVQPVEAGTALNPSRDSIADSRSASTLMDSEPMTSASHW